MPSNKSNSTNTVLITGSSRGIGRATARLFAEEGWNVAVHYLQSQNAAEALVKELQGFGVLSAAYKADMADGEAVAQMVTNATAYFGQIDILINNAGIAGQKLFTDTTPEEWRRMFAVDVDGVYYACRSVLPQMISRHHGKILNVSSIWGMTGASCEVAYSAAKAAVLGLTKALAKEVGPSNIQVNAVAPGVIDTEMNHALGADTMAALAEDTPLGRNGTPEEVARLLLFLAGDGADFITGQVISPNGGYVIC